MEQASGKLTFDTDGRLKEQAVSKSSFSFTNGALPDQQIAFNFGKDKTAGGAGVEVTQYGTTSEAYKTIQDGYTAGTLAGLSFNDDGTLVSNYTNGESIILGQVATSKFESNEGLFKLGQNRYRESRMSGQATIGAPGSGGRGQVSAKTIEASKTDIASEFINLMGAQRTFQANSKVIGVADEMMQDIMNIKRG